MQPISPPHAPCRTGNHRDLVYSRAAGSWKPRLWRANCPGLPGPLVKGSARCQRGGPYSHQMHRCHPDACQGGRISSTILTVFQVICVHSACCSGEGTWGGRCRCHLRRLPPAQHAWNPLRNCLVCFAGFSPPGVSRCGSNYRSEPGGRQARLLGNSAVAHLERTPGLLIPLASALVSRFLPEVVQSWTCKAQVWHKSPGLMNFQLW